MYRPPRYTLSSLDSSYSTLRLAEQALGLNHPTDPLELLIEIEGDQSGELLFSLMNPANNSLSTK